MVAHEVARSAALAVPFPEFVLEVIKRLLHARGAERLPWEGSDWNMVSQPTGALLRAEGTADEIRLQQAIFRRT